MTETPETPQRMTFDEQVCERLKEAFRDVFLKHPEVKCLSASIVWNGSLNDANILHGVWLGPDGPVGTPDAVVGSIHQTMRMLDEQLGRGMELSAYMQERIQVLGTETVRKNEELEKVKKDLEAAHAQSGQNNGGGLKDEDYGPTQRAGTGKT